MTTKNIGTTLPLVGGTMLGSLTLNANPSTNLGAATKAYVVANSGSMSAATKAEQITGTATGKYISPSIQMYNPSSIVALATFYYSNPNVVIMYSYNIASITRSSVGDYVITVTNGFTYNNTYSCGNGVACCSPNCGDGLSGPFLVFLKQNTFTATSVEILVYPSSYRSGNYTTLSDPSSTSPISIMLAGITA